MLHPELDPQAGLREPGSGGRGHGAAPAHAARGRRGQPRDLRRLRFMVLLRALGGRPVSGQLGAHNSWATKQKVG